MGLLTSLI